MILLPLLFLLLLVRWFRTVGQTETESIIKAAVALGLTLVAVTELLSVFRLLRFLPLCVAWVAATAFVLRLGWPRSGGARRDQWIPLGKIDLPSLVVIAVVLVTTLLIALLAAPNNWDSMTYHLARVSHWIVNRSVAHYPTNVERQLWLNPFAEFAVLNLQVLSGGSDRFANLVQWSAFAGSLVVVAAIVRRLGGSSAGAAAAAVFAATTPELILQSTSTQNDLVTGFWLLCFILLGLEGTNPRKEPGGTSPRATLLWAALTLGLALCTKPTGVVFATPFLIWIAIRAFRVKSKLVGVGSAVAGFLLVVAPVSPHLLRNWDVYANPFGNPEILTQLRRQKLSSKAVIADLSKNIFPHFGTRSRAFNEKLESKLVGLEKRMLNVDLHQDEGWGRFRIPDFNTHEDWAGNPLHLASGTIAIGWLLAGWRRSRTAALFATCTVLAFLWLCIVLRWQPWNTRLQVPFFLLLAPVVGVSLSGVKKWTLTAISIALLVSGGPALLHNQSRPLVGAHSILRTPRLRQYFTNRPDLYEPYWRAAATLWRTGCREVGLKGHEDILEYPLWQIGKDGGSAIRFEHVLVENPSGKLARRSANACGLLVVEQPQQWAPRSLPFAQFASVLDIPPVKLFQPESVAALSAEGIRRTSKGPLSFVLISPCRVVDTRGNGFSGIFGPPALIPEKPREFPLAGSCGIPASAAAIQANVTVANTQGAGYLLGYPTGGSQPTASVLNFGAGENLANAAVLGLGAGGSVTVMAGLAGTQLIIDVNGYYVPQKSGRAEPFLWAALILLLGFLTAAVSSRGLRTKLSRVLAGQKK